MSDDLDYKSDAELNELFAVELAGMEQVTRALWAFPGDLPQSLTFCASADAVLPWLEKHRYLRILFCRETPVRWEVAKEDSPTVYAVASSFPRAAVIALIRAKRATTQ